MEDHYKVLGLQKIASLDDIKKAYRQLSSKTHPDKGGNEYLFGKVKEAYDVLSNDEKRKQIDKQSSRLSHPLEPFLNRPLLEDDTHHIFSGMNSLIDNAFNTNTRFLTDNVFDEANPTNQFYSTSSVTTIKNGKKTTKKTVNNNGEVYTFFE